MKNIVVLILVCLLSAGARLSAQNTAPGSSFRWKHKTDIAAFSLNGLGFFWNIKKAEDPRWKAGAGFRFDAGTDFFLLGPGFDLHRIIDKGKISPMYGIQLSTGGVLTADQFGVLEGGYFSATPYAGIHIKTNARIELEAGLHLRYTISEIFDGFFATPLFFAMKF